MGSKWGFLCLALFIFTACELQETGLGENSNESGPEPCSVAGLPFGGGDGTASRPYLICTVAQFLNVKDFRQAYFRQSEDLDLQGIVVDPIGTFADPFSGNYDGGNHLIEGFQYLATNEDYVGLFRRTTSMSVIRNLTLNGVVAGRNRTGILVGEASGLIQNVRIYGAVTGNQYVGAIAGLTGGTTREVRVIDVDVTGVTYVGGAAGYAGGLLDRVAKLNGTTTANSYVGGLAGELAGAVVKSMGSGTITGRQFVGGLAGVSSGSIQDAYASVALIEVQHPISCGDIGGLVGVKTSSGPIDRSYATGTMTLTGQCFAHHGGLVSDVTGSGNVTNSFWNAQTLYPTSLVGTPLTNAEMQTAAPFLSAGWDFSSLWTMAFYPTLQWLAQP
jgi:hypothetical protein